MKRTLYIPLFFVLIAGMFYLFKKTTDNPPFPEPTTIINSAEEEENNLLKREAWFAQMHHAAPGTNWRALEYRTQKQRHERRIADGQYGVQSRGDDPEVLADGHLIGTWKERGSLNQAGSVYDTEYDPEADQIWLISAGGTLWRGERDGSDWEVINQDFQFDRGLLKFIPHDGKRRLLSVIAGMPHYSDDDGLTWTAAEGIPINDSWGDFRHAIVLDYGINTIYGLSKPSFWEKLILYKSTDDGETFLPIHTFDTHDFNDFDLNNPHNSTDVFLIERGDSTRLFKINQDKDQLDLLSKTDAFLFAGARANLAGWMGDVVVRFFAFNDDNEVFMTDDFGQTWELRGTMGAGPWFVGLYVSPSNPDALFMGEVHCYRSLDGGQNWFKINEWSEYYDNIEHKLHADMMHFNEFYTATGEKFLLVSNHGGLNISYDDLITLDNIGLSGLNVSQYYSVRTNQSLPYWVYAGSQDQGFQRSDVFNQEIAEFEQVISGDYGHIVMTDNGDDLWTVYPGGWVTYYNFAQSGGPSGNWTMESEDESVWLPPLAELPYGENGVFMAGGNINGGPGSFLVKLTYNASFEIDAEQYDFDFKSNSGDEGVLSAMEFSPLNPEKLYAATTNGRFFYSDDGGQNWEQNINFIPSGHYLYGQTIFASQKDTNTVWLGGSGYSNPPVYVSYDGGAFFQPFDTGLPPTLVFEITANEDETLLFASTEAGPFVYVFQEAQWYDLSGESAPAQTYWSVEYVREFNIVRYGTYGRGIWDFEIQEVVATEEPFATQPGFKVYPNPSDGMVQMEWEESSNIPTEAFVFDVSGKLVKTIQLENQTHNPLDMSDLQTGTYFLNVEIGGRKVTRKLFIR